MVMTEIRIINDLDENVRQYIFSDISMLQSYLFIFAVFDSLVLLVVQQLRC